MSKSNSVVARRLLNIKGRGRGRGRVGRRRRERAGGQGKRAGGERHTNEISFAVIDTKQGEKKK